MPTDAPAVAALAAAFDDTLTAAGIPPQAEVCVALSGGMDSCALLAVARRGQWRVRACHVNHGISPRADEWEGFCRRLCEAAEVPLTVHRAAPPPQASEDWGRQVRRRFFASLPVAAVVAAHHADDQAETLLLQLLRGGGVHGMGAMQAVTRVDGMPLLRPWLQMERRDIAAYAKAQRLHWIEDEDNRNVARRRNFLRWRALPLLAREFEGSTHRLSDAARHLAEGASLLQQLAEQDDAAARQADGGRRVAHFIAVGEARLRNWLYHALRERAQPFSEAQLHEAVRQLLGGKCAVGFSSVTLHGWRGAIYWEDARPAVAPDFRREIKAAEGRTPLPELGGQLVLAPAQGRGLSPKKIQDGLTLRLRQGGERLAPPRRRTRTITNLLQEAGTPPWRRQRLPLLYAGGQLAAVATICVAAEFAAAADETGMECRFEWD